MKQREEAIGSHGSSVSVRHSGDAEFLISIRGHEITVDQARAAGGDDAGPAPTELFVASLAACVASYGRGFLHGRGLPDAVNVDARWWLELAPARVARVAIRVEAPGVPVGRREAFRRAIEHCTVHNTLTDRPEISFELALGEESGARAS